MASVLEFWVPGRPIPKARPRVGRWGAYTPRTTKDYEELVVLHARAALAKLPSWRLDAQYRLRIALYEDGALVRVEPLEPRPRATRGDLDNLAKGISDALNKVAYHDDRLVRELEVVDHGP